jgi:hypothetical protein
MAKSNGFDRTDLHNNQEVAKRRTFFIDKPNAESGSVDTIKYSGRSGTAFKKGIYPLYRNSKRVKGRIRNPTATMPENWLSYQYRHFGSNEFITRNRKNVKYPCPKTETRVGIMEYSG